LAVWDNRSTFHAASPDYEGDRAGVRAVSVGERPYYDPASQSRRDELGNRLI
jgi:alpha-ketoglutarate-dependent taurine dioxygenase